nr:MAG TPA: hypothetical protein [Caudoviricetes sp.]
MSSFPQTACEKYVTPHKFPASFLCSSPKVIFLSLFYRQAVCHVI